MPRDAYFRHVGEAIQAARWEREWTQERLAAEFGLTGTAVSYWESGLHRPDAWTLDRLEAIFERRLRP